jgi:hypothetical protein
MDTSLIKPHPGAGTENRAYDQRPVLQVHVAIAVMAARANRRANSREAMDDTATFKAAAIS